MHNICERFVVVATAALAIALPCPAAQDTVHDTVQPPPRAYAPIGSYAVVVSGETLAKPEWAAVVAALRKKYDAALITYASGEPDSALPELKRLFPRYACFVATPEEAPRAFVVAVHRMTRQLDDDPYTDLIWAILTGYDAGDALRIAERGQPLVVERAASSMGPGVFKALQGGFASSETDKSNFWHKEDGGETVHETVTPDAIAKLVQYFNTNGPDMFQTSGHATENDWQTYYNIPGGQFRCDDGQLYGLDSHNQRYDINSPNAKIYMPMGNCLIGHIPRRNCMATAWMHTGGVNQMFGYTSVTFFGYMGWGIGTFFGNPWDLAEAFYFNNQSLIYELTTRFPEKANIAFESYDPRAINRMAAKYELRDRDIVGYLWDRDIVALYGDPAWQARIPKTADWRYAITRDAENVTVTATSLADGKWPGRPLFVPFATRLTDFRSVESEGLGDAAPVLTDRFVILPVAGRPRTAGDVLRVRFGARPVEEVRTSAAAAPLRASGKHAAVSAASAPTPPPFSEAMQRQLAFALRAADDNARELRQALDRADGDARADMAFLIANMPLRDLRELSAAYLLENVTEARTAREQSPWGKAFDDSVFRNHVLPYASLSESRDDWRGAFRTNLMPRVRDCRTAAEAALRLNTTIYDLYDVHYHATKRSRPDQGPLAAIREHFASCTGLSILLVDACRSVAIPARIAGVAQWTHGPGNHTWVEVMDNDGTWYTLGASESKKLNDVWYAKAASEVDASDPMKRVYAVTFQRSTLKFPMAWDPYATYANAIDRTDWYRVLPQAKPD